MPAKVRQAQDLQRSGRNVEAADLYIEALKELRDSGQRAKVEQALDALLAPIVESALTNADSPIGLGDTLEQITKSTAALTAFQKYDDKPKRITARLQEYSERRKHLLARFDVLVAGANQKAAGTQWNAAIMDLDAALRINPSPAVLEQQRTIIQRRNTYYRTLIEEACSARDWEKAALALDEFRKSQPPPQVELTGSLASRVASIKVLVIRDKIDDLRKRDRHFTAYTTLLKAQIEGVDDLLRDISKEGSAYYLEVGKQALSGGDIYAAYLAAVKALTLDPENEEAFTFHRDREDAVEKTIHVQIGFAAFDSPASEPNAGGEFSDNLITYMTKVLPYGIDIVEVERDKIDDALKQRDRTVQDAAGLLGVHFVILGNVSTLTVDENRSPRNITVKVQMGTDSTPNPQYEMYLKRYGNNRSRWPEQVPQTIEKERFENVSYEQTDVRMEGILVVSVRMSTTDKGAITQSETFTSDDKKADYGHGGITSAGIKDKAIDLPTRATMKKNLREKAVKDVAAWVLKNFEQRQGRYCKEAKFHIDRRENDKAVEKLAQAYLFCLREGVVKDGHWENDPWAKEIHQRALFELTESSQ
jgi:tetratricopeptide (TPR) repeat protein